MSNPYADLEAIKTNTDALVAALPYGGGGGGGDATAANQVLEIDQLTFISDRVEAIRLNTNYRTVVNAGGLVASYIFTPAPDLVACLRRAAGRLDSTAPTGTYFVQVIDSDTLPPDGAVPMLLPAGKIVHTQGVDDYWNFSDIIPIGGALITFVACCFCLSSTEFTKTISGAYLSLGAA